MDKPPDRIAPEPDPADFEDATELRHQAHLSGAMTGTPLSHPKGLYLLFIVEMWERFSYYGMRALLVLYLVKAMNDPDNPGRGWTKIQAYGLYGWYTGLVYLMPLFGGFLADKLLGTHRSMILGAILIALGHIVLGVTGLEQFAASNEGMSLFIGGLALIVVGTGYFKPCVSVMVGQLYGPGDPRRDGAFTIFYMGINLGAFLAPLACGTLGEMVGWHWGFAAAAVGMIAGLITYLIGRPTYLAQIGLPPKGKPNYVPLVLALSVVAVACFTYVYHEKVFNWIGTQLDRPVMDTQTLFVSIGDVLLSLGGAVVLVLVIWFIVIQQPGDKGPTATIFIFMAFNIFFWMAFEQAGSSLNVFADDETDRNLFGFLVPASWFQAVNPFVIILLGPAFAIMWTRLAQKGRDPSQPTKIGLGLLLLGLGFLFMVYAGYLTKDGAKVGMFWLTATYIVHTFGELCLSPTGLSYVTKAAPVRFVSLLMGVWFLSSFLAGKLSGTLGELSEKIRDNEFTLPWYSSFGRLGGLADFFLFLVLTSLAAGILILVLVPLLKKLMRPGAL